MTLPFLDTNVIIRYLTKDHLQQSQRAYQLFKRIEAGQGTVTCPEAVIIEAVHILSSKALYNLPRSEIRDHLVHIISLPGVKVPLKGMLIKSLHLYAAVNMDFVDALLVTRMQREQQTTIISFDTDFDKISGVNRREP